MGSAEEGVKQCLIRLRRSQLKSDFASPKAPRKEDFTGERCAKEKDVQKHLRFLCQHCFISHVLLIRGCSKTKRTICVKAKLPVIAEDEPAIDVQIIASLYPRRSVKIPCKRQMQSVQLQILGSSYVKRGQTCFFYVHLVLFQVFGSGAGGCCQTTTPHPSGIKQQIALWQSACLSPFDYAWGGCCGHVWLLFLLWLVGPSRYCCFCSVLGLAVVLSSWAVVFGGLLS